jgi:hypothetical protein
MQTDHFGNDPRGVTAHTQVQVDAWAYLVSDLEAAKNALRVTLSNLAEKHGVTIDNESVETSMQWIDDAFSKPITDLENRIGE